MQQEAFDLMVKSRVQMLLTQPFFAILAMSLVLEEDATIQTAATDGKKMYYSPDFVKKLSQQERNFLVAHEVMHPALKHLWRRNLRNPMLWNCACDFAINLIIKESDPNGSFFKVPQGGLLDEKFSGMTAEEIYDILVKEMQQNQNGNGKGNNQQGNSQGNSQGTPQDGDGNSPMSRNGQVLKPIDNHDKWEEAEQGQEGQQEAQEWDAKMVAALQAAEAKMQGKMPAALKRMLGNLTRPQKDWRTLLNEFIIESNADYSFNPPDRRFGDCDFFMPDMNDPDTEVKNLVFWVDTSGSIGEKELRTVMSEIIGAIQQMNGKLQGHIGYFDAKAYALTPFETIADVVSAPILGGGGTDFFEPFYEVDRQLLSKGEDVAGIIMLTDGYAEFPEEKIAQEVPTLWLITNEQQKPKFGLHTTVKLS